MLTQDKILIISYVFPPVGGAGVQRTAKLVKYLHSFGWETHVLTASNPSVPLKDDTLLRDIPKDVHVHKAFSLELPYVFKEFLWKLGVGGAASEQSRTGNESQQLSVLRQLVGDLFAWMKAGLLLPDPQIGWVRQATRNANKVLKKYCIQDVFVSAPPFSSLLIGRNLKEQVERLRVTIDFRDEWTEFYVNAYKFHHCKPRSLKNVLAMEKDVIAKADCVTMATESFCQNYRKKYPQHAHKIKVLTNGYDPDDFKVDCELPGWEFDKFNITYTGTIFGVTTARYCLRAVAGLLKRRPELKQKLRINFVGRITHDEVPYFDNFEYPEVLKVYGYVEHGKSAFALKNSDLLLVIIDEQEGSERIIAAKIFEYIYAEVPVLGLVPSKGEVGRIIQETKAGSVVGNRCVEDIAQRIEAAIDGNHRRQPDKEKIRLYSRGSIAKKLIEYLKEMRCSFESSHEHGVISLDTAVIDQGKMKRR